MTYGQIERILKNLLEERVSIRNIVPILETLSNYAPITKNPWDLTEKVREALGLQIAMQYADKNHQVHVMVLGMDLAELISNYAVYPSDGSRPIVTFDPVDGRKWVNLFSNALTKFQGMNMMPIVLCGSPVRRLVRCAIEREAPGVVVLSEAELYAARNKISIDVIGEITDEKVREEIA